MTSTDHAVVRRRRPAGIPVHGRSSRIQLAHPPLEHGHLRSRPARRHDAAGDGHRGLRLQRGDARREAAAQGAAGAAARPRIFTTMTFLTDPRFALRSLLRAKGLAITVVLTLALGIGANAAIFSVVRGVLLRPLVNRDEDRLIYIRQSAPGIGAENAAFSVPEIQDLKERLKSLTALGDFSTITFTMVGLGEPRQVRAGVVSGSYFDVMGLHPVLGRLINATDDGPNAAGVAVLTYRY